MSSRKQLARHLTASLLNGAWNRLEMEQSCADLLGPSGHWIGTLLDATLAHFGTQHPPSPGPLMRFISAQPAFLGAWADRERRPGVNRLPLTSPSQTPAPEFLYKPIPQLSTGQELASWLEISSAELDWFADSSGRQRRITAGPLQHYNYQWIPKRRGPPRLLEIPKARLKAMQRKLLTEILEAVPPHPAAHGFRRGYSCQSFARPHCRQRSVLRLDLKDFFPSVRASRVHALFRLLGYPWKTARLLTGLCCNSVPGEVLAGHSTDWFSRRQLGYPHLPQGAPTSPALANLAAYHLDLRLAGLAATHGMAYTRYADDLAISGDGIGPNRSAQLASLIGAIALEEGFAVNHHKTRLMRSSNRQRLTGLSINRFVNIPRDYYDSLKATLFNCVQHGVDSQNRQAHPDYRAHLSGKIAHVRLHSPHRAERLQALFDRIDWSQPDSPRPHSR